MADVYVIAGPTAGGKSARAIELAKELNGVVINADSRQIYDALPILTAQPSQEERAAAPHELYGVIHPGKTCSAGDWRGMVISVIEKTFAAGKTPIVVGGTGFYIHALVKGLSPMPEVPAEIRARANKLREDMGAEKFYEELKKLDPVMAARHHPAHTSRLVRAWEVLEATGKSLAEWQAAPPIPPPAGWEFKIEKIMPDRAALNRNCDARFLKMMDAGALEETKEFQACIEHGEVNDDAPVTKAFGFTALRDFLKGAISRDEAISKSQLETRQYAKRQITWFRHQL